MSEHEKLVAVISAALYKWKWDREWPPATLAMKVYYEDKARFIAGHVTPLIDEAQHQAVYDALHF